jgi:glycerol-3-phosphate dehydrogenase
MTVFSMISSPWTAAEPLPGGEFAGGFKDFLEQKRLQWSKVEQWLLERYARSYGTHMDGILLADPGRDFGEGVCEAELRYLIEREFALAADDVLWRRSKLGLHLSAATTQAIRQAMPVLVREITGYDTDDAAGD